jgi:hypothetical protein
MSEVEKWKSGKVPANRGANYSLQIAAGRLLLKIAGSC